MIASQKGLSSASGTPPRYLLAAASLATVFYVGFVYRAVLIRSFPGNRDVSLVVSQMALRANNPELFATYDFTAGLGNRTLYRPSYLNPFSMTQHYWGAVNGLWISVTALFVFASIIYLLISRARALPNGTAQISALVFAVWFIIPSTLRIWNAPLFEFGSQHFSFVYAGLLVMFQLVSGSPEGSQRRSTQLLGFIFLVVFFAGSRIAIPLSVWSAVLLVTGLSLAALWQHRPKQVITELLGWGLAVAAALLVASMIGASALITLISSSSARTNAYRGVGDNGESVFVIWQGVGSNSQTRSFTTGALIVLILLTWSSLSIASKKMLWQIFNVALMVQGYAFAYEVLFRLIDLEIGPRPIYLAEALFGPLLALAVGIIGSSSLAKVISLFRGVVRSVRRREVLLAILILSLPLAALCSWTIRNFAIAKNGLTTTGIREVPIQLSDDDRLQTLAQSRILLVDSGQQFPNGVWHPAELFALTNNRNRIDSLTVLSLHGHELSRWQHWLFESEGASGGQNAAIFLWAREFRSELAQSVQATHVLSDRPLMDKSLKLTRQDSSDGSSTSYLYRYTNARSADNRDLIQLVETDTERATTLAVSRSLDKKEVLVVSTLQPTLVKPDKVTFETRQDSVKFSLESSGTSIAVLPFEYSRCHKLNLTSGERSLTRLMPVNGRFLGVHFVGSVEGVLTFRSSGPLGLWCQMRDFVETRHIG